jgi:Cu(I)/Ag(I) efflux system membrane fusion protein
MPVTEGQYVTEGETILKLANLSYLWAEAQLYASQWPAANNTGGVMVEFPDLPGKKIRGKIALVNPEIEPGTRVNLLRISIPNPSGLLKPGMPAYVMLESKPVTSLTLPTDAVVRNGKINIVWVQSRKNTFKMKIVETGLESGGRIEIKSGISVGDIVVTGGAYLLNSEYIFQKGNNGMAGMQM